MTPVTNPNVTIGLYAFRPIAGPLYYIPQAWTRAVLDLTVGSLVIQETADEGGFAAIVQLRGTVVRATLAEDCLAWNIAGNVLATIPAGTVIEMPNGLVPIKRDTPFDGPEIHLGP